MPFVLNRFSVRRGAESVGMAMTCHSRPNADMEQTQPKRFSLLTIGLQWNTFRETLI
jgi:hypothetical protein